MKDTEGDSRTERFRRAQWDCVDTADADAAEFLGCDLADAVSTVAVWLDGVACSRLGEESWEC